MKRVAGIMRVRKDCFAEYQARHAALWPEMKHELLAHGYKNYSIFLDESTGSLFAYYETEDEALSEAIAGSSVCKKWWAFMKDIMDTNADDSPVNLPLRMVFHLD